MPVEDLDGLQLHTQVLGDAGPAVVLLHGLLVGSLATWYFSVAPTLARDHRVVMYDLRGHGLSPRAGDAYGLRAQARDLDRVLRRHCPDGPCALVGHSAGGAIALRFAIDNPHRVSHLVMIDTPLPVMLRDWIDRVRHGSPGALVQLLTGTQQDAVNRGGRQAARLLAQVVRLVKGTPLLDDLLAEPDFTDEELATLAVPLLLCYASRGGPVVQSTRERLAARVPGARLVIIEGGHFLPVEAPVPLTAAIQAFLDG
jgi:pimeloyl-ACP methyl ester carboxylesterase